MAYSNGDGLEYFTANPGEPSDSGPVKQGARWIRDVIAYLKDNTANPEKKAQDIAELPIGSIYMNVTDETDPSELLGYGTWTRLAGKFLLASDETYPTDTEGGVSEVELSEGQMPTHSHDITHTSLGPAQSGSVRGKFVGSHSEPLTGEENTTWSTISPTGGGEAHTNMPPYRAVAMWYRTA